MTNLYICFRMAYLSDAAKACWLGLWMFLLVPNLLCQGVSGCRFLYLSDQRIATVELVSDHEAILNYFNLKDDYEVIQAPYLVIQFENEAALRGHVIQNERPSSPPQKYQVHDLLKPRDYRGFTVLGNFRNPSNCRQAFLKVGSQVLELEPVEEEEFGLTEARVGRLDLQSEDRVGMIENAGFTRGYGTIHPVGSETFSRLERLFPDLESIAPLVLKNPPPRLPDRHPSADTVLVKVKGLVNREGGIFDLKVLDEVEPDLGQAAVETIRNSWVFLPAISKGEVAEAEVTLNVVFQK
ncbi:MAG: energy transducer TonB [Acidobacteria bacterium]|nr:energy transducer TonB [Acidobacteriota bacterium]